jgi:uncharacterized membrane protein YobD (UPF0266 family)
MDLITFGLVAFALLFGLALTALLLRANYMAMFVGTKDGKTVIDWNSKHEGKPEFVLLLIMIFVELIALGVFIWS